MSKTIIIKGKPCSGKSWLIRKIKEALQINEPHQYIGKTSGSKYNYYNNGHYYLIGRYTDNTYGGLDAFHPKGEATDLIEEIKAADPNAIIYCEGCITKVYPYDVKMYLQVDDDVLVENLKARRQVAINKSKKEMLPWTDAELQHKLDIFVRHDVAARNKKYMICPHNNEEQRQHNFDFLISLANE